MNRFKEVLEEVEQAAIASNRNPQKITVLAVSKSQAVKSICAAYDAGFLHFGVNRLEEFLEKLPSAPPQIRWHFIGALQRKKTPKILGRFHLIHSVDTFDLARAIAVRSAAASLSSNILLQVNISGEASKRGFSIASCQECFHDLIALEGIHIKGLMTMAPLTDDKAALHDIFSQLRHLKEDLNQTIDPSLRMQELSMGMSQDYQIAIEEGATIVRLGTAIFAKARS